MILRLKVSFNRLGSVQRKQKIALALVWFAFLGSASWLWAGLPDEELTRLMDASQPARAWGSGGAFVAQADDALSFSINSAGIAQIQHPHFVVSADPEQQAAGLALALSEIAAMAAGVWVQGNRRIGGGGLAWRLEDASHNLLLLGVGMRVLYEPERLEGLVFDLGVLARPVGGRMAFGASAQNLGPKIRWQGRRDWLPYGWRLGISYALSLQQPTLVSAEIRRRSPGDLILSVGSEWTLLPPLFVRLGYQRPLRDSGFFTVGGGLRWKGWSLDYVYVGDPLSTAVHRIQLNGTLGSKESAAAWALAREQAQRIPKEVPTRRVVRRRSPADRMGTTGDRGAIPIVPPQIAAIPERLTPQQDSVLIHLLSAPRPDVLRWEFQVRDEARRQVRHYGAVGHPPRMLTWDGLRDDGRRVAPGRYQIQLALSLRDGATVTSNRVQIEVEALPPSRTRDESPSRPSSRPQLQVACVPMQFTPDGDGVEDTTEFSILTDAPETLEGWTLQLSIHDPRGKQVMTFPIRTAPTRITWDGSDARGRPLPLGHYAFWVKGSHPSGRYYASPPQIVTISEREHLIERIVIAADVLFELDQTEIQPSAYPTLRAAAQAIRTHPDADIRIEGHADDSGDEAANMRLSAERAARVFTYLVEREGIPAYRLSMAGYGRLRPIDEDDPKQNRRVEIIIATNEQNVRE